MLEYLTNGSAKAEKVQASVVELIKQRDNELVSSEFITEIHK